MLNIRRAPSTKSEIALKMKTIYKNKITHLRGVNPFFKNCSIPIEIIIDHAEGELTISILLEDIDPLVFRQEEEVTQDAVQGYLTGLPKYDPAINYIEDYLDSEYMFTDANGDPISVKEYFTKNHIALFYSCGDTVDDMIYAEELKYEILAELTKRPDWANQKYYGIDSTKERKEKNSVKAEFPKEAELDLEKENISGDYLSQEKPKVKKEDSEPKEEEKETEDQYLKDCGYTSPYWNLIFDPCKNCGCKDKDKDKTPDSENYETRKRLSEEEEKQKIEQDLDKKVQEKKEKEVKEKKETKAKQTKNSNADLIRDYLETLDFSEDKIKEVISADYSYSELLNGKVPCPYNPSYCINEIGYCRGYGWDDFVRPLSCVILCPKNRLK